MDHGNWICALRREFSKSRLRHGSRRMGGWKTLVLLYSGSFLSGWKTSVRAVTSCLNTMTGNTLKKTCLTIDLWGVLKWLQPSAWLAASRTVQGNNGEFEKLLTGWSSGHVAWCDQGLQLVLLDLDPTLAANFAVLAELLEGTLPRSYPLFFLLLFFNFPHQFPMFHIF